MNGELASVRGIVDLSSREALDRAETFLGQQGYVTVRRADDSLIAERRQPGQTVERGAPTLTVEALPQRNGGVRIVVRGSDREGVQANQAAWAEWSESLPKKPEAQTTQPGAQPDTDTPGVPLPPPPKVESADLPPAPQPPPGPSYGPTPSATQSSGLGRGAKLAIGGCAVVAVLGLLLVGGCLALVANLEPSTESKSGSSDSESGSSRGKQKSGSSTKEEQPAVAIGEPVTVGDVTWRVTDARQTKQLTQQGVSKQFAKTEQGNFVIVDFDFTNNGDDAASWITSPWP